MNTIEQQLYINKLFEDFSKWAGEKKSKSSICDSLRVFAEMNFNKEYDKEFPDDPK